MHNNGLESFSFHAEDEHSTGMANNLRNERSSFPGFATTRPEDLPNLNPETAAKQYLDHMLASHSVPHFTKPTVNGTVCEFKPIGTETLTLTGTKTVKFRQFCNKIPIYGSLVTVEMDDRNELLAINSAMGKPEDVDPVARISPAQAAERVCELAGVRTLSARSTPRLSYYFEQGVDRASSRWRLVYVLEDVPKKTQRPAQSRAPVPLMMDYVIDAHSGNPVAELPRTPNMARQVQVNVKDGLGNDLTIWCMEDEGKRFLHDATAGVHTHDLDFQDIDSAALPGEYVLNPPDWSPGAISAHNNAVIVAQFLRSVLQRNGIDGQGGPLISSVNCVERAGTKEWRNAAWIGTQMVYGQKKDERGEWRSYAVGLDVVAHEIFHGVTDRTSRLEYAAQSGALNESYSDIFGTVVENRKKTDQSQWNWQLGEDLDSNGIPIRDLSNPTKYDQPAHMRDYKFLPITDFGDWGGVHINSGIHNFAAYKIMTAKDARGKYLFDIATLAALFYLALTQYLSRTSQFSDSRRAVTLVARTLFRRDPADIRTAKLKAIADAFDAVGIEA